MADARAQESTVRVAAVLRDPCARFLSQVDMIKSEYVERDATTVWRTASSGGRPGQGSRGVPRDTARAAWRGMKVEPRTAAERLALNAVVSLDAEALIVELRESPELRAAIWTLGLGDDWKRAFVQLWSATGPHT